MKSKTQHLPLTVVKPANLHEYLIKENENWFMKQYTASPDLCIFVL